MLKIRDNIDLRELEKYGFKEYNLTGKVHYEINYRNMNNIKINSDTRLIYFNQMSVHNFIPNIIYDLIKADMVEKIDD